VLENFPTFGTERNQKNRVASSTYSFSFKYAAIIINTSVISSRFPTMKDCVFKSDNATGPSSSLTSLHSSKISKSSKPDYT